MSMIAPLRSSLASLRRAFAWSNSRQSWVERLAALSLLVVAVLLIWQARGLSASRQVVLWSGWLVLVLAASQRGWVRLLGPVLFYDLVRSARRARYFLTRGGYLVLVFLLLCWVYSTQMYDGHVNSLASQADFAQSFFYTFLIVQLVATLLLTPAFTAGAVAEEKERKTLEFLLATDLRDREIVLSKLVSRLLNVAFLLIAGLPILSFLQFLGGVDPGLLLAGYAATAMTVLSLASLSILNSVLLKKARDAIISTYLMVIAYLILSGLSWLLLDPTLGIADWPSTSQWQSPVTVNDLVVWFNAGNVFSALANLDIGGDVLGNLPNVSLGYAIFHGLVALLATGTAVWRLRPVVLHEAGRSTSKRRSGRFRLFRRRPMGNWPIVWKEVYIEGSARAGLIGKLVLVLLFAASFLPVFFIVREYVNARWSAPFGTMGMMAFRHDKQFHEEMNGWVRGVGSAVACLMLLGVAVRAAGTISGERERQTLDGLLTSPLAVDGILWGKWIGAVLAIRWGWFWLGAIWFIGVITGGLFFVAIPILIVAWLVFAGYLASLGLYFSIASKSTMRATVATLVATLMTFLGHWLIWMCCIPLGSPSRGTLDAEAAELLTTFQAAGMTPPFTLGVLAFRGDEFWQNSGFLVPGGEQHLKWLISALIGLCLWVVATLILWNQSVRRFRQQTGRSSGGFSRNAPSKPLEPPATPNTP